MTMRSKTARTIVLALMMITMSVLPLISVAEEKAELQDNSLRMEAAPSPCQGADACRGTDAGVGYSGAMNITSDFEWEDGPESVDYWNTMQATGYSSTSTTNIDVFLVDMEPGYGIRYTLEWNMSGTGSFYDNYAYMAAYGGAAMSSYYTNSWGYCYYSTSGIVGIGSDGTCIGNYNAYGAGQSRALGGEEVLLWVWCYYCGYASIPDYHMNITTFPADNGFPGDWSDSPDANALLSLEFDSYPNGDYASGSFSILSGSTAEVSYTCDYWCPYETSLEIDKPDGTTDSWGVGTFASYSSGVAGTYTDAGTYTVTMEDTYGDGGMSISVEDTTPPANAIAMFSLTGDAFNLDVSTGGHVNQTDTADYFAVHVPTGYAANLTLDWNKNADLDLEVYSDAGFTTMVDYSWYNQPEFIDLGTAYEGSTAFVKVSYYAYYSTDTHAGYSLQLQLSPAVPPPCSIADDGGSGTDAGDLQSDATNITSLGSSGAFTGSICDGYDDEDWYSYTLAPDEGFWFVLTFDQPLGTEAINAFLYMDGYWSYLAQNNYPYTLNPKGMSTNESYYFNNYLSQETTVYIKLEVRDLEEDVETNYTIDYTTYDQSAGWDGPWDDAGTGDDGGNSTYGYDALDLPSMNGSYVGYGHDMDDRYDYYKIYLPQNYGLKVEVSFPGGHDIDTGLYYKNPASTYLYFIDSSYYDNPETMWATYSNGGQDLYIRVFTDIGGGIYWMNLTMITPANEPGSNPNDCGAGIDAGDIIYSATWDAGPSFVNNSNQADINGDANDTGGTCTGWFDYTWDQRDYYQFLVPAGKYINITTSFPDMSAANGNIYVYTYMYMCGNWNMQCVYPANPAYFVSQNGNQAQNYPLTAHSGLWPVGGHWVTFGIYSYGVTDMDYQLDIVYGNLSDLPGGDQDDANSGGDAGSSFGSSVDIAAYNNITANNTYEYGGWAAAGLDDQDWYNFIVPLDHGFEITLDPGYNTPSVWYLLYIYNSAQSQVGFQGYMNPQVWNSSTTNTYYGGDTVYFIVRNYIYDTTGTDYNITIQFYSLDPDGDGWHTAMENQCGTDPNDGNSFPSDTDGDGICDALDTDSDGDGVIDSEDDFPFDANETTDTDGDGLGDNSDTDLDGDGWNNSAEADCVTDPLDADSYPTDFDNDTLCDLVDMDDDNDGYMDEEDAFPFNATEWADNDNDRIGDNADPDDDNDGYFDEIEIECASDPFEVSSIPMDLDLDGICDTIDDDVDGDGVLNADDVFPIDPSEWADFDGDGIGDNADTDDDNDLWLDELDAFPYDQSEWIDTDGDGVGDNADLNDDGDAWTDAEEFECGSDALDADSVPDDYDGDMICDKVDTDDDGDGTPDTLDAFPFDATENADNDGDGIGDFSDSDDDNDGWMDNEEPNCGTDPMDHTSVPADNDMDHDCDITDQDDDNDGYLDLDDAFPMNPNEHRDLDGDGTGDNADIDDDGDGWLDTTELICRNALNGQGDPNNANVMPMDNETDVGPDGEYGTDDDTVVGDGLCNAIDPDDDNDGVPDPATYVLDANGVCTSCEDWEDHFPWDPTEQYDGNNDGQGDNGNPLGIFDDISAEPAPFIGIAVVLIAVIALIARTAGGKDEDSDEFDLYDETEQFLDEEDEEFEDVEEEEIDA